MRYILDWYAKLQIWYAWFEQVHWKGVCKNCDVDGAYSKSYVNCFAGIDFHGINPE